MPAEFSTFAVAGSPFLVSEELEQLASALGAAIGKQPKSAGLALEGAWQPQRPRASLGWFCDGRGHFEQTEANDLRLSFIEHHVELRGGNTDDRDDERHSRKQQNRLQSHDCVPCFT